MTSKKTIGTDAMAGAAAAAVVLPQAMAFGVALLAPLGVEAGAAALAGLLGAAALSFCSSLSGGTKGLVSAPTGPTLILLASVVAQLQGAGLDREGILLGLLLVGALTGVFQAGIGLVRGGALVKLMPYPVVAGFMTGSGILMVMSQIPVVLTGYTQLDRLGPWIPALTAMATIGLIALSKEVRPRWPATIIGLVGGTLVYHLAIQLDASAVQPSWVVGALPGPSSFRFGASLEALEGLPLGVVVKAAAALALLASLDTLLTAVIADVGTGERHDASRELLGQGAGQILASLAFGLPGAGTTGATVVAVQTGGRRLAGLFVGVSMLAMVFAGGAVGMLLPVSTLAGVILHVAWHMLDRDIVAWWRHPRTRTDAGIAVVVTSVTVLFDLMVAVGLGVAIAVVQFLRAQLSSPTVQRRSNAAQRHSVRLRAEAERDVLDAQADQIQLLELRGNLFFATADRLFEEVRGDLERGGYVIFDMRRVDHVDLTGLKLLEQIIRRAHAAGGTVCFCNLHREVGIGAKIRKSVRRASSNGSVPKVKTFNGADEALEWCEDRLLHEAGLEPSPSSSEVPLEASHLCHGLDAAQVRRLESLLDLRRFEPGEQIFSIGESARCLYIVRTGTVEIRLPTTAHHYKRLAAYGPGHAFGELSLLRPGPRTADAHAMTAVELYEMCDDDLQLLMREHADIAATILLHLGRAQARTLRWSANEMRRLAEW